MRSARHTLATKLWLRHALFLTGDVTSASFISRFHDFQLEESGCGIDPRSMRAWQRGRYGVSPGLLQRVESKVPGTKYVYSLASLLDPRVLSASAARNLVLDLFTQGGPEWEPKWRFGPANQGQAEYAWDASELLSRRADFQGFIAVLVLVRESMAACSPESYNRHLLSLTAALQHVTKLSWVKADSSSLRQSVTHLLTRNVWACMNSGPFHGPEPRGRLPNFSALERLLGLGPDSFLG